MAKNALMIGPVRADQPIDPTDPDVVGNIAGSSGVRYDAMDIIKGNAAVYSKLTPFLALGRDFGRSKALILDEVSKAVGETVEGASVRGSGQSPRVVIYLVRRDSGRSAKGMLPYGDLPKSEAAFQDSQKTSVDAARAARAAGGSEIVHGEDPRVAILTKRLEELEGQLTASSDPQPYDGYADAKVDEIEARIDGASDPVERELLKRQIRAYEESHKNRKGILSATEPTQLVPAAEDA
jgi:hypothetical protein